MDPKFYSTKGKKALFSQGFFNIDKQFEFSRRGEFDKIVNFDHLCIAWDVLFLIDDGNGLEFGGWKVS